MTGTKASAQVLYDNGGPALGSSGVADFADTGDLRYTMAGTVFNAPTSGTATEISFGAIYYGGTLPTTNNFVVTLYSVLGGAPSTLITTSGLSQVARSYVGAGNSQPVYEISALLNSPLTLAAGTSYFLGISDTTSPYEDFSVALTASPSASTNQFSMTGGPGAHFDPSTDALSFQLAVPEPSEWTMLAFGVAALCVVGTWRAKSVVN